MNFIRFANVFLLALMCGSISACGQNLENLAGDGEYAECTYYISNPSFEQGGLAGWQNDGMQTQANSEAAAMKDGGTYCEKWVEASSSLPNGSISQTIVGLPAGDYILSANCHAELQRSNTKVNGIYLFAGDNSVEITDPKCYEIVVHHRNGGNLHFGVKIENTNANWVTVDAFRLLWVSDADNFLADRPFANATSYILNPSFEEGLTSAWANVGGLQTQGNNEGSAMKIGKLYCEKWIEIAKAPLADASISQTVSGLPAGDYVLTANCHAELQRSPDVEITGAYLFAGNKSVAVSSPKKYEVAFHVSEGEDVTLGFMVESTNANWMTVDHFELVFAKDMEKYIFSQAYSKLRSNVRDLEKLLRNDDNLPVGVISQAEALIESAKKVSTKEEAEAGVAELADVISAVSGLKTHISNLVDILDLKSVIPDDMRNGALELLKRVRQSANLETADDDIDELVDAYNECKSYRLDIKYDDPYVKYLFTYFPNNDDENLYYAVSDDGFEYTPLNGGKRVMASDSVALKKGIRDPHLLRGVDGKTFYMVATDMKCSEGWASNRGMILYKSTDLVHWQHSTVHFPTRFPEWKNVTRVWAPETIWDPNYENADGTMGRYLIYYSLLTNDGKCTYDKVFYSYANDDFTDLLTEPQYFYDRGGATIDADIVFDESDRLYHMIYKNEGSGGICSVVAKTLTPAEGQEPGSQWRNPSTPIQQTNKAVEGGGIFRLINSSDWVVMYDCYGSGYYQFCNTSDWEKYSLMKQTNTGGAFTPRHGSVLPITAKEYNTLLKAFPSKGLQPLKIEGEEDVDPEVANATQRIKAISEDADFFTLSGVYAGDNVKSLKPGVYVAKSRATGEAIAVCVK